MLLNEIFQKILNLINTTWLRRLYGYKIMVYASFMQWHITLRKRAAESSKNVGWVLFIAVPHSVLEDGTFGGIPLSWQSKHAI